MAVLKTDATDRALLRKALHVQGVKQDKENGAILLNLIEKKFLEGSDEELLVMQKGLTKFGHMARGFRNHNDARLAAGLSSRIELFKQQRRKEIPPFNGRNYGRIDGETGAYTTEGPKQGGFSK